MNLIGGYSGNHDAGTPSYTSLNPLAFPVSGLIEEEGRARDASGNVYKTIAELQAEEAARRAEGGKQGIRNPNVVAADGKPRAPVPGQPQPGNSEVEEEEPDSTEPKTKEEEAAQKLVAALVKMWREPLTTLSRAGRAFEVC